MLILLIAVIAYLWRMGVAAWSNILTVCFAHILAGRAISIAQGTYAGLPKWLIVALATYVDTTAMFIIYPLFVYSYEHIVEGNSFQRKMRPILESAERNIDRFGHYKIAGVFLFVWAPLWMTGIIAGAILGYLLGLRTWITVVTVILGALAAVASWVYAYDLLFSWLSDFHQDVGLAVTVVLIAAVLIYRVWRKKRTARKADG